MSNYDPTSPAADLAEQILDEISSADQDWQTVADCARKLALLAERALQQGDDPQLTG